MPHITICPKCGQAYEESSEELANSPMRSCGACYRAFLDFARGGTRPPNERLTWYRFGKNGRKIPCDPPADVPGRVAA